MPGKGRYSVGIADMPTYQILNATTAGDTTGTLPQTVNGECTIDIIGETGNGDINVFQDGGNGPTSIEEGDIRLSGNMSVNVRRTGPWDASATLIGAVVTPNLQIYITEA